MDSVKRNLDIWSESRMASIPVGGLLSRNPVAYKWKALFRCWWLREAIFWRTHDLLTQSYDLHKQNHGLGARILLRSAFETLAVLIYLNQQMGQVLDGKLNFHLFSEKTAILLSGSRNGSTNHQSLNIVTIIENCDKRYSGIAKLYGKLSESAHPNYEGMITGYSTIDHEKFQTYFSNRWIELYGDKHLDYIELCMMTFHHEYDDVWAGLMNKMENWITENDATLEATKNAL